MEVHARCEKPGLGTVYMVIVALIETCIVNGFNKNELLRLRSMNQM